MKNLLNKMCIGTLILMFVVSCTSDPDGLIAPDGNDGNNSVEKTFKVSEEEAKATLAAFMQQFESGQPDGVSTRSASKRTIRDIQALRVNKQFDKQGVSTYAYDTGMDIYEEVSIDTLMYLMNFEGNQGFALVSADKRTTPVLAIIDEGALSLDTLSRVDNPGFLIFLEQAIEMQLREIATSDGEVATYASESGLPDMMETRAGTALIIIPARLKTKWGQEKPYDTYCPSGCPTGCVITAAAQALSFFQNLGNISWSYNGSAGATRLNWSQIIADCVNPYIGGSNGRGYGKLAKNTASADQVAHLMRFLGIGFKADYSSGETGAKMDDAVPYLKNWCGLSSSTGLKSYDRNGVRNGLLNNPNSVIITSAYATKRKVLGITVGYKNGHCWIIDGAQQIRYSANDIKDYVHCNWGWDGRCDGFYISDGFDTGKGPEFLGPNDAGGTSQNGHNYVNKNEYAILSR